MWNLPENLKKMLWNMKVTEAKKSRKKPGVTRNLRKN